MLTPIRVILGVLVIGTCGVVVYLAAPARVTDEDALASLSEPALSEHYTSAFWDGERTAGTPLWSRALRACRDLEEDGSLGPNCQVVVLVARANAQEELARQQLSERRRVEEWLGSGATAEIGDGLTGKGAKAGGLPTLRPREP